MAGIIPEPWGNFDFMHSDDRLFSTFQRTTETPPKIRAKNAFLVATKFLDSLDGSVRDEKVRERLAAAWIRAVKYGDFKRFDNIWKKYSDHIK